jgi:hypothetical protein
MRITFRELKDTTGTFEEKETTKVLDLLPQDDKKLHSSTSKVYTDPSDKSWWGMSMGDEINEEIDFEEGSEVRLERCRWRREGEPETEAEGDEEVEESKDTWNDKDCHSRPPDPEEELKSNNRSSHTPNSLGIDSVTTGGDSESGEGAEIVTLWDSLNGQLEQVASTFEVQRALIILLFNSSTSPTLKRDTGDISKDLSSTHTHRTMALKLHDASVEEGGDGEEEGGEEERDLEKWNNFEQFFTISYFSRPPSSVESTKAIEILLPSEENWARFSKGPGAESSDPFTTNSEPDENHTSYSPLDSPDTLAFKKYLPALFNSTTPPPSLWAGAWRYTKFTEELKEEEVNVNTEGANIEIALEAGIEEEVEVELGETERRSTGIAEIFTTKRFSALAAPTSTVKAKGMSDTSSNSRWFNLTSNLRQHAVFTTLRERSMSTRDMGTEEGESVAQKTL